MDRIKVAHITTVGMTLRYGLLTQLQSIREEGYDAIGISSPGPDVQALEHSGFRHIPVPMTRRFTPLADLLSLWRLYKIMRRERFTIVHTHNPKPGLLGQLAARLARVPIVINTVHGFYFHKNMHVVPRRFLIFLERVAARCSHLILSQNREDVETAIQEKICEPEKIKRLGNGIDIRHFDHNRVASDVPAEKRRKLGIPEGSRVVGFVGRLVEEKGLPEFLVAARRVVRTVANVRFLIVGPIDEEKTDALTPEIARDYGVEDACIFTGRRHDMVDLYALMDILVLPSHREGFPRTPMEASAMMVPCIATDIRGCREAVEHGRNGLLVPPGDVPALVDAIVNLLSDREKARIMGAEGRRMAIERFDEQLVFARVKTEYARLLHARGLPLPGVSSSSDEVPV